MPAVYTHYVVAKRAWERLPDDLKTKLSPHLNAYFFGAYGPDFCFFYQELPFATENFGSFLHRRGDRELFHILQLFAPSSDALFAYALGFLTHYAADTTVHPFVYAAAKNSLRHSRIENALDGYFKRTAGSAQNTTLRYFRPKLSKSLQKELFTLYATVAVKKEYSPLLPPVFFRAISLFNAYLPPSNRIFGGFRAGFHTSRDPALDGLLLRSVERADELITAFLSAIKNARALPPALFTENFAGKPFGR